MSRFNFIIVLFFSSVLLNCKESDGPAKKTPPFKIININITENGVLQIQGCAKWYIDFSRIKKSFTYKNNIISVGLNGGFACLNSSDLKQDTSLERKMNSDFFTNASLYQDTLFAEKFDSLYFWDSDKWKPYLHSKPIKYFDLLFEDSQYAFYSSCMGEFGSILFIYNKRTNVTKAEFTTCPNSVIKTDSGFYVGTHLYHMIGHSYSYTIKKIEQLQTVSDSTRFYEGMFDRDSRVAFLQDTSFSKKENYSGYQFFYPGNVIISASFIKGRKIYHIVESRDPTAYRQERDNRYIAAVENDTLKILDTLRNCSPKTTTQFNNATIINESIGSRGFMLVRNDTLFKITFSTLHPNYHGPRFEEYNLETDTSKKPTVFKEYTYYPSEKNDWMLKPGQPEREITFSIGKKYKIAGYYGNSQDGNYIYTNERKVKLKFRDDWNFLKNIFTYDSRLFLFFGNLGNVDYKYGLIEITDIDQFILQYKALH